VQAGHAHIHQPIDPMPKGLGNYSCFFGDGEIASPRRHDQDGASRRRGVRTSGRGEVHGAGQLVPDHTGKAGPEQLSHLWRGASAQEAPGRGIQMLTDGEDLLRSLSFAEHDFGVTLTQRAMMVQPGERQVFKGQLTQAVDRGARWDSAGGNLDQEGFELLGGHATWATGVRYSRKMAAASPIDSIWKRRCRSALDP